MRLIFGKFPPTIFLDYFRGNIENIASEDIPDFELLLAGFPCQPFLIAGYREGFEDKNGRGNLFFEIVRILEEKKPKTFLGFRIFTFPSIILD